MGKVPKATNFLRFSYEAIVNYYIIYAIILDENDISGVEKLSLEGADKKAWSMTAV